jgi:hypothetical protein
MERLAREAAVRRGHEKNNMKEVKHGIEKSS